MYWRIRNLPALKHTLFGFERILQKLNACDAVIVKRTWYPPSAGELVLLAWEDMGRPSAETVAYMRSLSHGGSSAERSEVYA